MRLVGRASRIKIINVPKSRARSPHRLSRFVYFFYIHNILCPALMFIDPADLEDTNLKNGVIP